MIIPDSEVSFLADVIEAGQHDELVVEHVFEAVTDDEVSDIEEYSTGDDADSDVENASRNPRQEHASYLWPLFSHQNNYVFWLTITFPTVFCLAVRDVPRWPKCMRDIILVVQNIIMHA